MNKLIVLLAFAGLLYACQTGPSKLGEAFTEQDPLTADEVVAQATQQGELRQVQLAGKIDKNCMEKGCWLTMMTAGGKELLVTFKDEKFTIPINSEGKQIVTLGDARMDVDTVDGRPDTSYTFESAGLMFK